MVDLTKLMGTNLAFSTLLISLGMFFCHVTVAQEIEILTDSTYGEFDKEAKFIGGNRALIRHLEESVVLPVRERNVIARQDQLLSVFFVVYDDSTVSNIKVMRSTYPDAERFILKALKEMPKWQPAMKDGKPVDSRLVMAIQYGIMDGQFTITGQGNYFVQRTRKTFWLKFILTAGALAIFWLLFTNRL